MADAAAHKDVNPWSNEAKHVLLTYDFAEDGGAAGDIELCTVTDDSILLQAYTVVQTACTSGGSATVAIGVDGGDEDAIMTAVQGAVANLTLNAVLDGDAASERIRIAAGEKIQLTIATAALTAGKLEVVLVIAKQ